MTDGASANWTLTDDSFVERLVCHSRLPLIAGLDAGRPAVHVWECGSDGLRRVGITDPDAAAYPAESWERAGLVPAFTWHPYEPRLILTGVAGLRVWTPDGAGAVPQSPADHSYHSVAFSPDGRTLWASPSSLLDEEEAWQRSDTLDLATGALRLGPRWDTDVVEHPGGGLVVTLASDQGATYVLFARPDGDAPARMRIVRHAIILDVDGYEAPTFSDDGRYLALRGNSYVHSLDVFELPAMRKVLGTTLGDPYPGYPYPPAWLEEQERWSHHNVVFAPRSGTILLGTAQGTIATIGLDDGRVSEHEHSSVPISALAITSRGRLVVADRSGRITVMNAPGDEARESRQARAAVAREVAERLLAATSELPDDADLDESLIRHDGERTWSSGDLETVTTAEEADPTWLRLRAAINTHRRQREEP
ncbi:hypothetical protein [Actinoplanes regularis]|uniref:WD40-like Beta Propeller Repeat n=1 Tax=Actinoplanes regularis TaxID=52697 RepID=A0A238Z8K2_9ACTN|nr:hypothetical protein [Actinoplanes regularis]GIE85910.1 hypothetical protein Are01nite_23900 [Actinoplanes regularis]SNR79627.1 hypothetical protein SAMN06264365_105520 [Actinoplanes regularis]